MKVKCKDCDREFSERANDDLSKVYVHRDEVICEGCLTAKGILPDPATSLINLSCHGACDLPCGLPYCTL